MNTPRLRFRSLLLLSAALAAGPVFADGSAPAGSTALFNGRNLDGWVPFAQDATLPAGETWSVSGGVIHCTGKPNGYLRSAGRYRDYRLTVEWRWVPGPAPVDDKGRPRARNSGVLLHMQGADAIWPQSLEAQLMESRAGDLIGIDSDQLKAAREKAITTAGKDASAVAKARTLRRLPRQKDSSEKPVGEWNRYEITCRGDTMTVVVNGVEQNRVTGVVATEGSICLQSEGAPLEFRNVTLEALH